MSDIKDTDPDITPVDGPRIVVTGDGPNLCYGVSVEADGFIHAPEGRKPIALCACGLSNNRPFCDGNHKVLNEPNLSPKGDK